MSDRPQKGPGAHCHFRDCKNGPGGSRGIIGEDKRAHAIYCDQDCSRAEWERKHPDKAARRGGRSKQSYDRRSGHNGRAGTRKPTTYRVFKRRGRNLVYVGEAAANKKTAAKDALGGDVAIPVRSLG